MAVRWWKVTLLNCVHTPQFIQCQEMAQGNDGLNFLMIFQVCREGWQGWGCEDGDEAQGWSNVVTGVCLLTLSNLFFLPPAVVAFRRRLFSQALLFIATMVASVLYHACDNEVSFVLLTNLRTHIVNFFPVYSATLHP